MRLAFRADVLAVSVVILLVMTSRAIADEGMWLLNRLPAKQLKDRYDFVADDTWTRHVMRACVRMESGGSGSFVSADGLILTNHHIASDSLQAISTPEHDFLRDGFIALSRDKEVKIPGLEVISLVAIEDVSDRVKAAVTPGMSPGDADKARKAAIASIEAESLKQTGLRSEVVKLYGGFLFHLYRYKSYTDVRIVFAPESSVGFFGGDPDNFEYPRYCLDMALFRAYENGKPARIEHYFTFAAEGVRDGDLVFVAGHPGHTDRLMTAAALEHRRDVRTPYTLDLATSGEQALLDYAKRGPEEARQAADDIFGTQNWLKVIRGEVKGLGDPAILNTKKDWERQTQARVAADPKLKTYADVWDRVAAARQEATALHPRYELFEDGNAFWGRLFDIARPLVRLAAEDPKPDAERLREFNDSQRPQLELSLFSEEPIYEGIEITKLTSGLNVMKRKLGDSDPLVAKILDGKSPADRATELVKGTKLRDVAERKRLKAGGQKAIDASDDPMIRLAVLVDEESRRLRALRDAKVDEPELQAYADLARLIFELDGPDRYPDATYTLRLSFGTVSGYEQDGKQLAPWTTVGGTFANEAEHNATDPWKLPTRWHDAKSKLTADTPFNFVSTADIIGGNSGSPTLNRKGEITGLVFDGNRFSFSDRFGYSESQRRTVHVDTRGIKELMSKVYGAGSLLKEMRITD